MRAENSIVQTREAVEKDREAVDIDILMIFRNGDIKVMKLIRTASTTPTRIKKWNQFNQLR